MKLNKKQWFVFIVTTIALAVEIGLLERMRLAYHGHTYQKIAPLLYVALTLGVGVFLFWAFGKSKPNSKEGGQRDGKGRRISQGNGGKRRDDRPD